MKTVLVFIDWFLPGYKAGGPIRSVANMIDHLGDRYRFYVVARDTDYCDALPYASIQSDAWNEYRPGVQVYYFSKETLNRENMLHVINGIHFDVAYINGVYSWHFSILPLILLKKTNARIVVASRGMLSGQALGVKGLKKRMFLWMAKTKGLYKRVIFQSTSEQETRDIERQIGAKAVAMPTPNLPMESRQNARRLLFKKPGELRLINIARVSPEKNNGFAVSLLKACKGMNVSLDLYGPVYDKEYYERCKEQSKRLPPEVKVRFMGPAMPEELERLLAQCHFLLFPTTGENFGHAIYEAFAVGVPAIISDRTPWRNLAAANAGWDLPLEDPEKWANVLKKCYEMDQEEYDSLCAGARDVARKYIDQSDFIAKYERLFGERD